MTLAVFALCCAVVGVLVAAGLVLLLVVGAINSRAEDEYWDEVPLTETRYAGVGSDSRYETGSTLRKAA